MHYYCNASQSSRTWRWVTVGAHKVNRLVKISMISTKPVHFKDKKKIGAKMFGMISITTHKNAPRIAVGELQLWGWEVWGKLVFWSFSLVCFSIETLNTPRPRWIVSDRKPRVSIHTREDGWMESEEDNALAYGLRNSIYYYRLLIFTLCLDWK